LEAGSSICKLAPTLRSAGHLAKLTTLVLKARIHRARLHHFQSYPASPSTSKEPHRHGQSIRESIHRSHIRVCAKNSTRIGPDKSPIFPPEPTDGPKKCSKQTAEFCATTTKYGVSTSDTITKTTSTSVLSTCGTITGCAVTDSSTTATKTTTCGGRTIATGGSCPTAVTYPHVVYPVDGTDSSQTDEIARQLLSFVEKKDDLTSSGGKRLGINYWKIPLNDTAPKDVRSIANVRFSYRSDQPMRS